MTQQESIEHLTTDINNDVTPVLSPLSSGGILNEKGTLVIPDFRFDTKLQEIGRYLVSPDNNKHGGQGYVYKAKDTIMGISVALKFVRSDIKASISHTEARTMARLRHPNIPTVRNYIQGVIIDGNPYDVIVTDWINGPSLEKQIRKWRNTATGPSIDQIRSIVIPIADALSYTANPYATDTHANKFHYLRNTYLNPYRSRHRDTKPGNIMLDADNNDTPVLVDFGITEAVIAESQGALKLCGTPAYMNPEVIESKDETEASEVFSFAVAVYQTMTDEFPFDFLPDDNPYDKMVKILTDQPTPISIRHAISSAIERDDIRQELDRIFNKALAKNPDERYQTVREFGQALDVVLSCIPGDTKLIYT